MHPLRKDYGEFFNQYPIETMVTLRITADTLNSRAAENMAREFVRNIAKGRHIQVAAVGVFNNLRHPHLHLCLFGKQERLTDLSDAEAQKAWRYGTAKVSIIYDAGGGCYLGKNITPNHPDKWELIVVGRRLLRKSSGVGSVTADSITGLQGKTYKRHIANRTEDRSGFTVSPWMR